MLTGKPWSHQVRRTQRRLGQAFGWARIRPTSSTVAKALPPGFAAHHARNISISDAPFHVMCVTGAAREHANDRMFFLGFYDTHHAEEPTTNRANNIYNERPLLML